LNQVSLVEQRSPVRHHDARAPPTERSMIVVELMGRLIISSGAPLGSHAIVLATDMNLSVVSLPSAVTLKRISVPHRRSYVVF
jgi:hypothetical protein